jgi:hypothetical protein
LHLSVATDALHGCSSHVAGGDIEKVHASSSVGVTVVRIRNRPGLLVRVERRAECTGSLCLQIGRNVRIDVCRDSEGAVAEALLNDFHRRPQAQQHACVSVPEVVRTDSRKSGSGERA